MTHQRARHTLIASLVVEVDDAGSFYARVCTVDRDLVSFGPNATLDGLMCIVGRRIHEDRTLSARERTAARG